MSRTPLHRLLRRVVSGPSRREVLAGALASSALLASKTLASPRPRVPRPTPRVAIIGAGLSGLSCALTLAEAGIAATVYEASGRVGGRVFSNMNGYWDEGQVSEWGAELIDTANTTVLSLIKRFELKVTDLLTAQEGREDLFHFAGQYYSGADAERDYRAIAPRLKQELEGAREHSRYDRMSKGAVALDRISIQEWIETRVPGGRKSSFGRLLDVAYEGEFGAPTDDQSALTLVRVLGESKPNQLELFGDSDERFHIDGGNQRLPLAMAAHLGNDRLISFGKKLAAIKKSGATYELVFDAGTGRTNVTVDLLVLALPFSMLSEVDLGGAGFDARKLDAIRTLGRGRTGKLALQFRSRPWTQKGPWPGRASGTSYTDQEYQCSWEVTRGQAGTSGILLQFTGGNAVTPLTADQAFATAQDPNVRVDAARFLRLATPVMPGLSAHHNGKAASSIPHKHPLFRASYPYYRVGQYARYFGHEAARQGNAFFASDCAGEENAGYMEGAANAGIRAAREILASLK